MAKSPSAKAGDTKHMGWIPGWGRSPGGGNGNPLQCSRLGDPMDGGAWRAPVQGGHKESAGAERLNTPLKSLRHKPVLHEGGCRVCEFYLSVKMKEKERET